MVSRPKRTSSDLMDNPAMSSMLEKRLPKALSSLRNYLNYPLMLLAIVLTPIAPSLAQNAHSQQAAALMGSECLSSHLTTPVGSSPFLCCSSTNMWMSLSLLTALDPARNDRTWYRRARCCKSLSTERSLSDSQT